MISVSVIIPVYNAEKYLSECLESILNQSLKDLEIICINDGSIDNSLAILEKYQQLDSRILIVNQNNQGVSVARNAGLQIATGKYIGFVDADDTVAFDFFEKLYMIAINYNTDIVFSESDQSKILTREEIVNDILPVFFQNDSYNSVWNKIFKNEVIQKNRIIFPLEVTHGEDAIFNLNFICKADLLFLFNYFGYNYRETENSATRNPSKFNYLQNAVEVYKKDWPQIVPSMISEGEMVMLKEERFINNIISQIYIYAEPSNGMTFFNRLKKLSEIVNHPLVQYIFNKDQKAISSQFSKYTQEIFKGIKDKNTIKLYLLTLYSYYRNK